MSWPRVLSTLLFYPLDEVQSPTPVASSAIIKSKTFASKALLCFRVNRDPPLRPDPNHP